MHANAFRGSALCIENVRHHYGKLMVLNDVSVAIAGGEFLTLLGASGSGKTTLLRIIGGLIAPSAGRIAFGGRDITRLTPEARDIGFVFQNYALFPHLTVGENVAFALTVRSIGREEKTRRVAEALDLVGLSGLSGRYPGQLSGGQQQRVALARALVFRPGMLLLDEPLGALDKQLRQQLAVEIRELQRRSGITMVYVTHDQEEAFTMSTQVAVMVDGAIRQMAPPTELYKKPIDQTVARFVGETNVVSGLVKGIEQGQTIVETPAGALKSTVSGFGVGDRVVCGVRPEHVRLQATGAMEGNRLAATVRSVIFGGSWHRIGYELGAGPTLWAEGRGEPPSVSEGDQVVVAFDSVQTMLFGDKE
jgi:heme ABC exporter ATP-binding subunit CcmA